MTLSEAEEILASFRFSFSLQQCDQIGEIGQTDTNPITLCCATFGHRETSDFTTTATTGRPPLFGRKVNAGKGSFQWEFRIANLPKRGF